MELPESFAVALPDADASGPIAARLDQRASLVLDHASGRPWIRARLRADPVVVSDSGATRLVLIGPTSATQRDLVSLTGLGRDVAGIIERVHRFHGNFAMYLSVDGRTVACGTVSQNRRLFHSTVNGVTLIGDRADVLAQLGERTISPMAVGMRLLPNLPHPHNDFAMWDEVHPVAGGAYIDVDSGGTRTSTRTWWTRPAPELSRDEGAGLLRDALDSALAARTGSGVAVSADLSGGLDSTPVCYFASQGPSGVLARTFYTDDPGGREDLHWAERALVAMPGVTEHEIISVDSLPDFYGGLEDLHLGLDEPSQTFMAAPRLLAMVAGDVERGVGIHFTGIGGDHLFRSVAAWDHDLARSKPMTAWRRARTEARANRVSFRTTLRQLTDRQDYATWLRTALRDASQRSDTIAPPGLSDWGAPLAFPAWMTDDAVDAVIARMIELASDASSLSSSVAEHFDLYTMHEAGRVARGMSYLGQPDDVLFDSPLIDDHVIEAVFAVRYDERDTPMEWKPLMKEAMRGLLPDDYLHRATKVGGGPQAVRGYAKHYPTLAAIWEESGVLDQGLIDRQALVEASRPNDTRIPSPMVITLTNLALFLRDVHHSPVPQSSEEAR